MLQVRRTRRKTIGMLFFDIISINALLLASYLFFDMIGWQSLFLNHFIVAIAFFTITIPLAYLSLGLYEDKVRENFRNILRRALLSVSLSYLFYEMIISIFSYSSHNLTILAGLLLSVTFHSLWRHFIIHNGLLLSKRKVVFLGAGDRASFVANRMRRAVDRKHFSGWLFFSMGEVNKSIKEKELVVPLSDEKTVSDSLISYTPDVVVLANEPDEEIDAVRLLSLKMSGVEVVELEDFVESELGQIAVEKMKPEWLLLSSGFSINKPFYEYVNTAINTLLAIFVGIVTSPLMVLAVIAIYFDDGKRDKAGVLYKQTRVGMNGKTFEIIKFRSMGLNAEADGIQWATKNDIRVTRVGAYLRKYRIDELPQLINVLRGEMCFVGPRPERPEIIKDLEKEIPFFNYRHCVKPGLTGWAQINYPYGASLNCSFEKLKFDLYYVKHRSFLLDMYSLLRTVETVLFGRGR